MLRSMFTLFGLRLDPSRPPPDRPKTGGGRLSLRCPLTRTRQLIQAHWRVPVVGGKKWRLQDQLTTAAYDWNGDDLESRGLFLDMTPWQACVFGMSSLTG